MAELTDSQRPFMTTSEIVLVAEVHPNTVAMWRASRKIVPKDRIGSSFLYDRQEVMNFLKTRNRKPTKKVAERTEENAE